VTTFRVLITCPQLQRTIDDHRATFAAAGVEISVPPVVQQLTEAELIELLPEMDGIIVGDDPLTAGVLAQAPRLRIISKWGVGIDNIDLRAASERGIAVANTPGMFGDEVADVVIGYLILLARQLDRIAAGVRAGGWPKVEGVSLSGRTLGIIGLGAIGRAVAIRGNALGMVVIGSEVVEVNAAAAERLGVTIVDREALIRRADVISLNCPLTAENRHMLDASALETAKRGAWIINTARGPLIDETALVAALHSGQIGAAALDVFEVEPLPFDSPLREFDNVVLGSHNASNTAEAVARTSTRAIENLLRGLQGDR
jgi:D-3-phosphoglycerate dehydrogenase / 2-oxoglutarate reductase